MAEEVVRVAAQIPARSLRIELARLARSGPPRLSLVSAIELAPLWSIDDVSAKQIALGFYRRAYDEGELPANVFRVAREGAGGARGAPLAGDFGTHLAYQFFGHPRLVLERA
jgi:hypothetical protein